MLPVFLYHVIIIIIIIIKNEKIKVTLCENAAGALYIVSKMCVDGLRNVQGWNKLMIMSIVTRAEEECLQFTTLVRSNDLVYCLWHFSHEKLLLGNSELGLNVRASNLERTTWRHCVPSLAVFQRHLEDFYSSGSLILTLSSDYVADTSSGPRSIVTGTLRPL